MAERRVVLYLDMWRGERIQEMKLAGIRRFARMTGWEVVPIDEAESRPHHLKDLLPRHHPVGIIVECSAARTDLPPRLFRGIPVVYLDCSRNLYGRMTKVVHDTKQTVRTVFRELAANRPTAYAFVGYRENRTWSVFRERAFLALVKETGAKCRVFKCVKKSAEARSRRLDAFVAELPQKAAVFAANDNTAREVIDAAKRVHRAIPRSFTLLGVDNLEERCIEGEPTLSSIQIDFERAGYLAARALDDLLHKRAAAGNIRMFGPLMTLRRETTRGSGGREPRSWEAVETIRAQACEGLTASEVIAHIGGSRRLVELRFREALGHSIHDEIESVRLEHVKHLLLDRSVALSVIIDQSGYPSGAALRKAFRLKTGKSLSDWRSENA